MPKQSLVAGTLLVLFLTCRSIFLGTYRCRSRLLINGDGTGDGSMIKSDSEISCFKVGFLRRLRKHCCSRL